MNQKLTILFDLDGTIINTAPDLMHAHNHVMKKYGYSERQLSDIKKLAGRGSKVMLTKSINEMKEVTGKDIKSNDLIDTMTNEFVDYYSKNILKESTLKKGLLNFLSWCKNNSISLGVCTNKQEHLSIDLLKKIKIYDFFDYVAGGNTFNIVRAGEAKYQSDAVPLGRVDKVGKTILGNVIIQNNAQDGFIVTVDSENKGVLFPKSRTDGEPDIPYSKLNPNNIKPEANEPKITYFKEASFDDLLFLVIPASI